MWAEAPHQGLARSLTPGLLSSTGVTLVSESCPNWQLDRTNTISIVVKAVDGLACCERAAEGRERAATTGPKSAKSGPNLALHNFLQL